mgnify:CR=1 FL=1
MTVQTSPQTAELAAEFTAALQWWRDAGVDLDFTDDATDWLNPVVDEAAKPAQGAAAKQGSPSHPAAQTGDETAQKNSVKRSDFFAGSPPQDLAAFRQWWLEAPGLDAIGPRGRIAPRGPQDAQLMVLVADPEERDRDQLLRGPQGKLLTNILAATGMSGDDIYFASALPRHTPMADTAALASEGMDAVTLHHIELVSPQRLIVLGTGILPLIGQDVSNPDTYLREINQNGRKLPVLVNEGLESLMAMPRLKARFWRRWIEWTAQ